MRLRLLGMLIFVLGSIINLNAQDVRATETARAADATQTAVAATHAIELATDDPYALTATALIRAATQTAAVSTGRTALPVTAEAQVEGSFELTATALIQAATQQASASPTPVTPGAANGFALSATFFIFAGLLLALLLLGAVVVRFGRRNTGSRG
jgi:cytoskeletal protein RodZ